MLHVQQRLHRPSPLKAPTDGVTRRLLGRWNISQWDAFMLLMSFTLKTQWDVVTVQWSKVYKKKSIRFFLKDNILWNNVTSLSLHDRDSKNARLHLKVTRSRKVLWNDKRLQLKVSRFFWTWRFICVKDDPVWLVCDLKAEDVQFVNAK